MIKPLKTYEENSQTLQRSYPPEMTQSEIDEMERYCRRKSRRNKIINNILIVPLNYLVARFSRNRSVP